MLKRRRLSTIMLPAILMVTALALAGCANNTPTITDVAGDGGTSPTQAQSEEVAEEAEEAPSPDSEDGAPMVEGSVPAPEFPTGLDWINVDAPLTMEALRGKVVLLDFWTYGCINCIHMFPILAQLEDKYADELVIIGVHSAKFANEGQTENIRQIVQRYGLRHPVINDDQFVVWQLYRANAWPSFALIDPRGNFYAMDAGEIPFEVFDRVIGEMVAHFDSIGELDRSPLEFDLEGSGDPATPLRFPGKVLADGEGNRLFIADSSHHRIVIADLATYEVLDVIGAGRAGLEDGDFETARFNTPQGMALDGDTLYVADTNNHAIRAVDLSTQTVTTIAGTGVRGDFGFPGGEPIPGAPTAVDLRSPWDVELGEDGLLYIAMAGTHQILALDLEADRLEMVVGSGREALVNDTLLISGLAQPSGLYYDDGLLYFADSESSSIRVADFATGTVRTVAGPLENTLFDFGDVDGPVGISRIQHPLDVVGTPESLLYIVDTYNNKVKRVDPATNQTTSVFGLGETGGFRDGDGGSAQFDEPGGLDYADGKLYVADTNNHAIRVIDLAAGEVSTITFPNPEALRIEEDVLVVGGNQAGDPDVTLPEQTVAAGAGEIVLALTLPDGFTINSLIDSFTTFSSDGDHILFDEDDLTSIVDETTIRVPVELVAGEDTLYADLTLYYCRYGEEGVCLIETVVFEAPLDIQPGGESDEIVIEHTVELPEL
jgi:DNA-binding beta-propeller fold protein YncE